MQKQLGFFESAGYGLVGLVVFLGIWYLLPVAGFVPQRFLPGPVTVIERMALLTMQPFAGATLPAHIAYSFTRFASGFLLAALIGIPLGLIMGWFRIVDEIVAPLFDGLRFIAPIAWVPFAALWFGTGIGGPVMIIFAGAFPPCVINAYRGAKQVDPQLIEAAEMLGTSHLRMMTEILLPASVPSIVAGLRVAAGLGWQSLVGAELIVASTGVGFMMVQAQANVATSTVMSGMVAIGIVGLIIDMLLRWGEAAIRRRRGLAE